MSFCCSLVSFRGLQLVVRFLLFYGFNNGRYHIETHIKKQPEHTNTHCHTTEDEQERAACIINKDIHKQKTHAKRKSTVGPNRALQKTCQQVKKNGEKRQLPTTTCQSTRKDIKKRNTKHNPSHQKLQSDCQLENKILNSTGEQATQSIGPTNATHSTCNADAELMHEKLAEQYNQ